MIVASFHTQPCNHLPPPLASHFPGLIAEGGVAANRPPLAGRGLYPACSRKSSCRCTVGRASGKRIASVLLRCCHGIASLLLPCTSLVHPLYIRCTCVGTSAALRLLHRIPASEMDCRLGFLRGGKARQD